MTPTHVMELLRLFLLLAFLFSAFFYLERRGRIVTRFLSEPSTAFNLAVARIAVMATTLAITNLPYSLYFAQMDKALLFPVNFWGPWFLHSPSTPAVVTGCYWAMVVFG